MTFNTSDAQVKISAAVTGTQQVTGLTKAIDGTTVSIARAEKANQQWLASLERQSTVFGKSKTEIMRMEAAARGLSSVAEPTIAKLEKLGINGVVAGQMVANGAKNIVAATHEADLGFKKMLTSSRSLREMIVLLHESLIMGNYSRFGGSLMVEAEQLHLSEAIFTATFGVIAAGAVAVGGLTYAFVRGEMESTKFARSMAATGGMAGITEAQFRQMAGVISNDVPGSAIKSRNALIDLISTGQFTGDTLLAIGQAATRLSDYTGQSASAVVKDFSDMKNNAAEWAVKMNDTYHFLSESQYEYILQLQNQGLTEVAEKAAANDLFDSLGSNGPANLGLLERAWYGVRDAATGAFNAMENVGRAKTPQDTLNYLLQQQATVDQTVNRDGKFALPQQITMKNRIDSQVRRLQQQIDQNNNASANRATYDSNQQAGITAYGDSTKFLPPADQALAKIAQYEKDMNALLKVHSPRGAILQNNLAEFIRKTEAEYGPKAKAGLNKPDANGYTLPGDDPGKLSNQLSMIKEQAAATHQSESAVLQINIAIGKLAGFTAKQITELKARAAQDDKLAAQKAATALQGRYQSTNDALSAKNTDLSSQLNQMIQFGSVTKQTELAMINLKIAQGDLKGIPQSEIDSIRALAMQDDALTAAIAKQKMTGLYGTQQAFSDYVAKATDAGMQMKKVWTDTFTGMEDIMVTMLEGGKVNWNKYALSVVNDMLKMEIESRILGPLINALGGIGGGTNGSGFGNLFGALMSGFGSGGAMSTNALRVHQGGAGSVLGGIGGLISGLFANGGIMTSGGPIPLNKYANGGVANTPQLAMFGEGRGPEAYVPLPDGRSIPVSMRGGLGGGQTNQITNHIHIASDGTTQATPQQASAMARGLTYAIQQELIKQQRDGGLFSSTSGIR
ncbi:MAG TPA: phage tail length tape measure family protein [Acidocella sp.]|nr:phage tail length tape measure family protein [Acidocella sp.]